MASMYSSGILEEASTGIFSKGTVPERRTSKCLVVVILLSLVTTVEEVVVSKVMSAWASPSKSQKGTYTPLISCTWFSWVKLLGSRRLPL